MALETGRDEGDSFRVRSRVRGVDGRLERGGEVGFVRALFDGGGIPPRYLQKILNDFAKTLVTVVTVVGVLPQ